MNQLEAIQVVNPEGKTDDCAKFTISREDATFTFQDILFANQDYVFSCWVKSDAVGSLAIGEETIATSSTWSQIIHKFTASVVDFAIDFDQTGVYYFYNSKLERGNTPTDWTPAPEDLEDGIFDAQTSADSAQSAADEVSDRVTSAQLSIDSINAQLQTLVVGENGESMMTQTEDGFRFDFSSIQKQITNALDAATSAENDLSQVSSDIDSLKESTSYLTELNSYITMGDSEGTPYIELGQKDGEFKVRITNTEMSFMQGTDKIAYITNNQLYIQSSVVTDEMKIGATDGFIWKRRGNGHMGLRWVNGDYES